MIIEPGVWACYSIYIYYLQALDGFSSSLIICPKLAWISARLCLSSDRVSVNVPNQSYLVKLVLPSPVFLFS